ncbi:MAG: MBL fold metallo-hydrolase [Flavobacteriaceae bacterium]|nr:MBL fold metallo-hydrolase [Flavobacteriaceae bacterium]
MKVLYFLATLTLAVFTSCNENTKSEETVGEVRVDVDTNQDEFAQNKLFSVTPISHATMVMKWNDQTIFVDPVGGADAFENFERPDIILVTDIHGDHLNIETLEGITGEDTRIIAPQAVVDELPKGLKGKTMMINNGQKNDIMGFEIEAIPMYNLPESEDSRHIKGRGNGYVIESDGKRLYISGDTEDIAEMRQLQNIDIAFVCMNLPYTMTVESAADAVLDFAPDTVYPYHYRGKDGLSDVKKFEQLIKAGNADIKVTQLDWYPSRD